ncbi:MAG: hypothetical protein E7211_19465 [Clostridium lundense]|nr:hypothetical protein [Clostridium lundense]
MRQSIEDQRKYAGVYPDFIARRMDEARAADTPEKRRECLAEAIAANGLYLRAREIAFYPDRPYFPAIQKISGEILKSRAFAELMADGGDRTFAETGNVSALVEKLKEKNDALNAEGHDPTASEVIEDVQKKARTWLATPRDYAKLVAAYRLSSWKETVELRNGKTRDELRCDYQKRMDAGELNEETEHVLKDPDFRYLMKHENKATLQLNAVNMFGISFLNYSERAEKLREIETQRKQSVAPVEKPNGGEPERAPEKKEPSTGGPAL